MLRPGQHNADDPQFRSQTALRPADLAREFGLSTQAVRNYTDAAILPPVQRTAHRFRVYGPVHVRALATFRALVPAHGHAAAAAIMRAVHAGALDEALALVDAGHVQLGEDRATLDEVRRALRELAPQEPDASPALSVGPLAHRLGLRPATLRAWERAGVLRPRRDPRTGYRFYAAADVRDARLAHQLRRGGYPLARIAAVLAQVRAAGGVEPLRATLDDWDARLTARGMAMLDGAAELSAYLRF